MPQKDPGQDRPAAWVSYVSGIVWYDLPITEIISLWKTLLNWPAWYGKEESENKRVPFQCTFCIEFP